MVHDFNTNRNISEFLDLARGTTCYIKELQNCWTLYTESITQTFVEKPLLLRKMLRKNENHSTKKWDGDGHLGLHLKLFFFHYINSWIMIHSKDSIEKKPTTSVGFASCHRGSNLCCFIQHHSSWPIKIL